MYSSGLPFLYKAHTNTQENDPRVALRPVGWLPWMHLGASGESRPRDPMAGLRAGRLTSFLLIILFISD